MTQHLQNKKILLAITGSIAAYKSLELIRELQRQQAKVKVVLTLSATAFITPLSVQALTGEPPFLHCIDADQEAAMGHIELARWADLFLIAPASANTLAKLAHGLADDLLTTLYLATHAPVFIAPAMNTHMWQHAATQENCQHLSQRDNVRFLGPEQGVQACGDVGPGRLIEPLSLISALAEYFQPVYSQQHVVITAGPTQEPIDPVRYLSNHSSGKMGYALAHAASQMGMRVTLISGPTTLQPPPVVRTIKVTTAKEMLDAVLAQIDDCDIFIGCAAVADYAPKLISQQKIKKDTSSLTLELIQNPDILHTIAHHAKRPALVVGFAAETTNLLEHAGQKLKAKNLDMIIANDVSDDQVFGQDENQVAILFKGKQHPLHFARMPKVRLAQTLCETILSTKASLTEIALEEEKA